MQLAATNENILLEATIREALSIDADMFAGARTDFTVCQTRREVNARGGAGECVQARTKGLRASFFWQIVLFEFCR